MNQEELPNGIVASPKGISVKGITILKDRDDPSPVVHAEYQKTGGRVSLVDLTVIGVNTRSWKYKLAMVLLRK